ncbi:MAG: glycosyltransferase [Burkholderiaceae bacterium]
MPRSAGPQPHVVVVSSLFPSCRQPGAGLFVRERVFRVGRRMPLAVVAPTPWFPMQRFVGRLWPGFRPGAPRHESQQSRDVWFPRFFSVPAVLKRLDGIAMALGAFSRLKRLKNQGRLDVIDAHFGFPDGYAAGLLGRWLDVPVTITMRGTEQRHAADPVLRGYLRSALLRADRVFAVSESLRQVAISLGIDPQKVRVVGNGVDLDRFHPVAQQPAREQIGLAPADRVLISVGGLVERKGFHRVIECLPQLRQEFPTLKYLVVGGPSPEGDWTEQLKTLSHSLGLDECVRFLGPVAADDLHRVLSAAEVFVLATRNEGWANVFLEAMACGLPVVTTDVGGNREVVSADALGELVPFGDKDQLLSAIRRALSRPWDKGLLRGHAEANTWDRRIDVLESEFRQLHREVRASRPAAPIPSTPAR